jgi:hypothetical protein
VPDADPGRLSDAELAQFMQLLRRYAVHDLDQFQAWRLDTPHGEVFIHITRQPAPGAPVDAYTKITLPDS